MAWTQRDNGDIDAKVAVREEALRAAGDRPGVLDLYAGHGEMRRHVWASTGGAYLGVDRLYSRPPSDPAGECWRGDNQVLLARAMAVAPWQVVDLDAYGNPWPLLRQVLRLATAPRLVVTATCGIERAIRVGSSDFAAAVAGASRLSYLGLLTRWYPDVIRWAVGWATAEAAYRCARGRQIASRANPQVHYWLLEFCRVAQRKVLLSE